MGEVGPVVDLRPEGDRRGGLGALRLREAAEDLLDRPFDGIIAAAANCGLREPPPYPDDCQTPGTSRMTLLVLVLKELKRIPSK